MSVEIHHDRPGETGAIALVPRVSAKFGRFSLSGGSEFLPRLTCGS